MADDTTNPFDRVTIPGQQPAVVAAPEAADNPFGKVTVVPLPAEPTYSYLDTAKDNVAGFVNWPVRLLNNVAGRPLENYLTPGTEDHSASIRLQQYLESVGSPGGRAAGGTAADVAAAYALRKLPFIGGAIIGAAQPSESDNETAWNALFGGLGAKGAEKVFGGLLEFSRRRGGVPAITAPTPTAPTTPTTPPITPTPAPNPNNPAAVQAWLRQNYGNVPNAVPAAPVPPPTTGGMTPAQVAAATAAGTGLSGGALLAGYNWDKTKKLAQDYLGPDWWMLGGPALAAGYGLYRGGGTQIGQKIGQGLLPLITSLGAQAGATTAGRYADDLPDVTGLPAWMASGFQ